MRRVQFNAMVNMAGFLVFAVLTATGLVELLFLPPGTGGRGRGGEPTVTVLGLGRHEWGDIHNLAGIAFLGIVVLHLVLHWRWVKCLPRLLTAARQDSASRVACPDPISGCENKGAM